MARVSTAIENQRRGGSQFAFQKGLGKITNATVAIEKLGSWLAAGYRITVQRLGKDLKPTDDEELTQFLPLGAVMTRDEDALFHPGKAKGPDDEDPQDLGGDEETEGNALICAVDDAKIDMTMGGAVFCRSLQEKGFKANLLNGYAPNFIGTVGEWDQQTLKERDGKNSITALVATKILEFPYESKNGAGGKAAAGKSAPASTASGKAGGKSAPTETAAEIDPELESLAVACLGKINEAFAGQTVTRGKIQTKLITLFSKVGAKPATHGPIQKLFEGEWFVEKAGDLDWVVEGGNVTIPKG